LISNPGDSSRRINVLAICAEEGAVAPSLSALTGEGFVIQRTGNVFRAVADFARNPADMAVIDVDSLAESELECVRIFRELNDDAFILVVFSLNHRQKAVEALRLGADATLLQPFYPSEILAMLRRWASRSTARRSSAAEYQKHLDALARLAKGTAHEINNPLTTLSGWLQMMEADDKRDAKERRRLTSMREEADRIAQVVERLIAFGQEPPSEREPIDMNALVTELLDDLRKRANGVNIEVELAPGGALVMGDDRMLRRACKMMFDDALAAVDNRGRITVTTRTTRQGFFELSVRDDGRRIPADQLQRAFEPYRTMPRAGESMSLAYPAIYGIMRSHGGDLALRSDDEHGTEFLAKLPVAGS
jgi:two-component system NtrC family sensor kinase